ncbi:MAG: DUF1800 domain-containing protein [Pseudomonadota bacterium]
MIPSTETIAAIRFGYGFRPGQTLPRDAEGLIASLTGGAAFAPDLGGPTLAERGAIFLRSHIRRKEKRPREEIREANQAIGSMFKADTARRVVTAVRSPHGFFERLAWFWGDHFAVAGRSFQQRSLVGRFEADAIRPHLTGSFRDMLRATTMHPAMLLFLNQNTSMGPNSVPGVNRNRGLNENLAREIIELHTLGVGAGYSQTDVRQFAELLTGLGFDRRLAQTQFVPRRAEPGPETVLGVTYGSHGRAELADIESALDALAAHPATARHIARKLATHFVSDAPSEDLINHVEAAFRRHDGALIPVYTALLEHPDAWSSFGQKVKQPFDFVVSSIRATDPTPDEIAIYLDPTHRPLRVRRPLVRMNQIVYVPPGPQGWPEEAEAWITPQGLSERIDWASRLGRKVAARTDPRDFLRTALADHMSDETEFAATRAAERWEGIALVLASPEFNRR